MNDEDDEYLTQNEDINGDGSVDVLDLLDATDDELLRRHGRWYLADREPRWLRRNALIVIGNRGDRTDPRTVATLERYCAHADPHLREHAA